MDRRRGLLFTLGAIFISTFFLSGVKAATECREYTRCEDCITLDPSCAWCNDIDVLVTFAANSSSQRPAQLCGTVEELLALDCRAPNIINPQTTVQTENVPAVDSSSYVSLTSATVNLRPGLPASFNLTVTPPESSAVDMYLLMDLSLTMQPFLGDLPNFARQLETRIGALSTDLRIGFGSFIDKTVPPFADKFIQDFPCAADSTKLNILREDCDPVYSFRHVLSFTSNLTALQTELSNAKLSASPDHPEGILDAMLQSALCESELGWRPKGQSQRIIVALTNGDYHYALDGKIGGLVSQPSALECRLNPVTKEYSFSHLYDYPSSTLISDVLNDNLITPIFAVSSDVGSVYDGLASAIRTASMEILSENTTVIIERIENQYRIVSGTVVPILTTENVEADLSITVLPVNDCAPGNLRGGTTDVCLDVNFPNNVVYAVEISGGPSICQLQQPIQAQIQFIRFGTADVEINFQCDCDCEEPVANSEVCSGQGTLECSTCVCNDANQIGGAVCECPVSLTSQPDLGCRDPQDSEGRVCNGQGTCFCGQCQCNPITEDSSLVFQGPYCQFDQLNCPQARNEDRVFKPCAGNGVCTNSRCVCEEGFTGGACECTTDNSTCITPRGEDNEGEELCSGLGQCVCGQCVCEDYSVNFGQFCEECLPCRTSCSKVSPCVQCLVMAGRECPQDLQCQDKLQVNDTSDATFSTEGMKICSLRSGSCEVQYYLARDVRGEEPSIQIFMDSAQSSLRTLGEGSDSCNPPAPIWPIFVGIILGTIFIGVLVLVLWKCFAYLGEYVEYRQWENTIKKDTERSGENPLFIDPTSEYSNPRYVHRPT